MAIAHPALSMLPADHFLLTALLLNLTLLIQWTLVRRRNEPLPLALAPTDVPNLSWLEPFSPERALRRARSIRPTRRPRRLPVNRPLPAAPRAVVESAVPLIVREQLLL